MILKVSVEIRAQVGANEAVSFLKGERASSLPYTGSVGLGRRGYELEVVLSSPLMLTSLPSVLSRVLNKYQRDGIGRRLSNTTVTTMAFPPHLA